MCGITGATRAVVGGGGPTVGLAPVEGGKGLLRFRGSAEFALFSSGFGASAGAVVAAGGGPVFPFVEVVFGAATGAIGASFATSRGLGFEAGKG